MIILILLTWIIVSIAVGCGASNRNRFGFGWFLFAFILSPFVAGFVLIVLGAKPPRRAIGTVEAVSPFRKVTPPQPKLGDWSNVAWTPEQAANQAARLKEIRADEARKRDQSAKLVGVVIVAGLLVFLGLGVIFHSAYTPPQQQATSCTNWKCG